jgi:DNA-binding ferritin-like protein
MQLYAHNAHNLVSGRTFFEDHAFLGELYATYEAAYDSVVERMIGLSMEINLAEVQKKAAGMLEKITNPTGDTIFNCVLECERTLCKTIETEVSGKTQGTIQLLGDIANASEVRQYKLNQRLK